MKIQDFVKKEPGRASYLIHMLSVAFLTCFFALAAFGGITIYAYTQFRQTNTALFAADILSLETALKEENASDIQMYTALLCARTPHFLPKKTAEVLNDLLISPDIRFVQLCDEVKKMTEADVLNGARLAEAVERLPTHENRSAAETEGDADPAGLYRGDPIKAAERYFGIREVFHCSGTGVYCKNIVADFGGRNDTLTAYASVCTPGLIQMSERECIRRAEAYAAAQQMYVSDVHSAKERGGIWWIELSDRYGTAVKIGVRGDTGRVCFYLRRPNVNGEKE